MKTQIVAILGLALLAAVSAPAQNMNTNPMKVPVAFMAGDKTFPAGEYRVQFNLDSGAIMLLDTAGPVASMLTVPDGEGYQLDALEFQHVGDTWVLRQVRINGRARSLVPSKFEKVELAKLKSPSHGTLIASTAPGR
jgi:hypothetical protein